jgi:putative hydrolase of the HAD superfamily
VNLSRATVIYFPSVSHATGMAAVFFDVDGTLVRFDRPYEEVLRDAAEACGVPPSDGLVEAYDERFYEAFAGFAAEPYREAAAAALDAVDAECDPGEFASAVVATEFEAAVATPGAARLLGRLADRHRLGVLSNGVPRVQLGKLACRGLDGYFDAEVVSYDVGAHKPDPAIFEAARAALDADEYVYVADNPDHDLEPAREAGFFCVYLNLDAPADRVAVADFEALADAGRLFGRDSRSPDRP